MNENIDEFSDKLWSLGFRKIYLSHYEENETLARQFAERLPQFHITIGADARKLGKDFVTKCIEDSDLLIVLNPDSNHENVILQYGGEIFEVCMK